MTYRHVVVLVFVVGALVALPAVAAQGTPTPTETPAQTASANESVEGGFGTQLTAFLQSSSAAANDSVERGMWGARFDSSDERRQARMVTNRVGTLERRLERLRERNATLRDDFENGSVPEPAYVARQSRLAARIDALQAAVNQTDEAARTAGVNDSRIQRLRRNASELAGPAVAAVAVGAGGPPEGVPGAGAAGGDRGPPENASAGNGTERGGPPGETGGAGADPGRSDDATNGTASPSERGGDGAGQSGADDGESPGDGNGGGDRGGDRPGNDSDARGDGGA